MENILITFLPDGHRIRSNDYTHLLVHSENWDEIFLQMQSEQKKCPVVFHIPFERGFALLNLKTPPKCKPLEFFKINNFEAEIKKNSIHESLKFQSQVDNLRYQSMFKEALQCIKEGTFYQINLSIPFVSNDCINTEDLYYKLSNKFQGNYHALLPLSYGELLSFSPELFLDYRNNILKTVPIKGTAQNCETGIDKLLNSKKESAELSMIVDLLRNDLNRCATDLEATVDCHREIMKLNTIAHTYSEISIKTDLSVLEIIKRTFPGGSISGCPKQEAVKWIHNLEIGNRDFYTGIIGSWYKDQLVCSIVIRSMLKDHSGKTTYHAGGGIVSDSIESDEYQEILLKSKVINE